MKEEYPSKEISKQYPPEFVAQTPAKSRPIKSMCIMHLLHVAEEEFKREHKEC